VQLAKKPKYTIFTIIIANIKKALALKKYTNSTIKVLVEYYKRLDIFIFIFLSIILYYVQYYACSL